MKKNFLRHLSGALLAGMLLLSACSEPLTVLTATPAETALPPADPTPTVPVPTSAPTQTPVSNDAQSSDPTSMDVTGVAQSFISQVVAAVPVDAEHQDWLAMPEYTLLSLEGYPVTNHSMKPQIYVFPVEGLDVNENAATVAVDLQALLQSQQAGQEVPLLPLQPFHKQMRYAQVKFLDFQTGKGVRFLTQYANGIVPINNQGLFYTFQGLTNDGKYYVAAILPVTLDSLPADTSVDYNSFPTGSDYAKYLDEVVATLNQTPDNAFKVDLSKLDIMIQSIVVK